MDIFDKDCLSEVISYLTAKAVGRLSMSCKDLSGAFAWNCIRVATVQDYAGMRFGSPATLFSCSSDDTDEIDLSRIWKVGSEIHFTGLRSLVIHFTGLRSPEVTHANKSQESESGALLFAQMVAPQLKHFVYGGLRSRDVHIELNPEILESGTPTNDADVVWKKLRRLDLYPPFVDSLPRAPKLEQLVLRQFFSTRLADANYFGKAYPSAQLVDVGDIPLDLDGCRTQADLDAKTREILGFPADKVFYNNRLLWAHLPVDFPASQKFIDQCHENKPPSVIFATLQDLILREANTSALLELIDAQLQRAIKSTRRCSEERVMPFVIHTIMQLQAALFKASRAIPEHATERAKFWLDQFKTLFPLRCFDAWKMWLGVRSSLMEPWMSVWLDSCRVLSSDGSIPYEEIIVPASMEYTKIVIKDHQLSYIEFPHSIHTSDFFPWELETQLGQNVLMTFLSTLHSWDIEHEAIIVPLLRGLSSRGQKMQTDIPWGAVAMYLMGKEHLEEFARLAVRCFPASIFVSAAQHVSRSDNPPMAALKLGRFLDEAFKQLEHMDASATLVDNISVFYRTVNRYSAKWAHSAYLPLFVYISLVLSEKYGAENADAYAICVKETGFRVAGVDAYRRFLLCHIDGAGCFAPERELEIKQQVADALGTQFAEDSVSRSLFDFFGSASSPSFKDLLSLIDLASDEDLCRLERSTCCSLLDWFVQKVQSHRSTSSPELRSIFQRLLRSGCFPTKPCNLIEVCHSLNSDPATVALALERQPISPNSLLVLRNMLLNFFSLGVDPKQLVELLARPEARKWCRNKRNVVKAVKDSTQNSSGSASYTLVPEDGPSLIPNAMLEYVVKFTEPFFDCLHDAHTKCKSSNDALSWVEEILLAIAVMDWNRIRSNPDAVGKIWRRILMFQDRSGLSDSQRLFHTKESDFLVIAQTDKIMTVSGVYDASIEELHWDHLKMQAEDRKSPMSVVLTSKFSLALFNSRDSYSDRTRETLAAALFPSPESASGTDRVMPYAAVVYQLSKMSKEIDGIVELPPSLRVLLSSHTRTSSMQAPAPSSTLPPSHLFGTLTGRGAASSFFSTPSKHDGQWTASSANQRMSTRSAPFATIATGFGSSQTNFSNSFQSPKTEASQSAGIGFASPFTNDSQGIGSVPFTSNSSSSSFGNTADFSFATSTVPMTSPAPASPAAFSFAAVDPAGVSAKFRVAESSAITPSSEDPFKFSFGTSSSPTNSTAPESSAKAPFTFTFSPSSSPVPAPNAPDSLSSTASSSSTSAE